MTYSVNHLTRVVFVPREDMPIVQASPEVRELDLAVFHENVRLLEGNEEGIVYQPDSRIEPGTSGIVARTPEETFGATTLAPVIQVINGYQVEFEDGLYSVAVSGGNTNLELNAVRNQVGISVSNSAGLVNGDITAQEVEGDINVRDALRLILAATTGRASGAETTQMRFRDSENTKDRITATVDEFGNRSSVTLDPS